VKIAISQPTFLPWQGYFALINYVDEFIFLDNVQFQKRSWQQRNKIKFINNKELMLTVPVITKNRFNQKINEVIIDQESNYINKHLKTINLAYKKTKYFDLYYEKISSIYNRNFKNLIELNLQFINFFLKELNIKTAVSYSSNLDLSVTKQFLIDSICKIKGCNIYVSTKGSSDYLDLLGDKIINYKIEYFNFKHIPYNKNDCNFIKYLSILDLLFNIGPESKIYLEKNFYIE
jgi:hypothetical protein